jgi:hypothetical protein
MRAARATYSLLKLSLLLFLVAGCSQQNPLTATRRNEEATLRGALPMKPLAGQVITTWIDKPKATMSTLFGNELAIQAARSGAAAYPAGSVLSAVTWHQQEDARWFGGKIPAEPVSVEVVTVKETKEHGPAYLYRRFEGNPLKEIPPSDDPESQARAKYLLEQRAAVMP